jgi:hypothetical protein
MRGPGSRDRNARQPSALTPRAVPLASRAVLAARRSPLFPDVGPSLRRIIFIGEAPPGARLDLQ